MNNPNELYDNLKKMTAQISSDLPGIMNSALDAVKPFLGENKKYPVVINGKRGVLSVFKNNAVSIELENASDTDIKHILDCVHDRHPKS